MTTRKHTYQATLPDGVKVTRTSARTYTNIVYVTDKHGKSHVAGWCGSPILAKKLAASKLSQRIEKLVEIKGKFQYVKTNEHPYVTAKIIPVTIK